MIDYPELIPSESKPSEEDNDFDCYELESGNHVCSTDTSSLKDGYMLFSKYEHDAVATAKEDPFEEA